MNGVNYHLLASHSSKPQLKRPEKKQSINNSVRKGDTSITHVGDTILAAAAEAGIDENWFLLDNQSTCNAFINGNTSQISEILLMENIYVSIVTQE